MNLSGKGRLGRVLKTGFERADSVEAKPTASAVISRRTAASLAGTKTYHGFRDRHDKPYLSTFS
jgi:hypothetical protein